MKHIGIARLAHDPFREEPAALLRRRLRVLGGDLEFDSNDRRLLDLVDVAYRRLPRHTMSTQPLRLRLSLRVRTETSLGVAQEPPAMVLQAGAGVLCGTMNATNFAVVSPALRSALVVVSRDMLQRPYYARYELIEFAVFTLASRAQQLVPLHAGCVGSDGSGLLLMGQSGAGKSTVAFHCLLAGMQFISEDSTFVHSDSMLATGVPNFLHLRADSLTFLRADEAARIRKSPIIRRRSGIEKFELDLRQTPYRLAPAALQLRGIVFLASRRASKRASAAGNLLTPLDRSTVRRRLTATQSYAAGQAVWPEFIKRASSLPAFELRRGNHPSESAAALRGILQR